MTLQGAPNTRYRCSNGSLYLSDSSGFIVVNNGQDRDDLIAQGMLSVSLSPTGSGGFYSEYSKYWGGYRIS